VKIAHVRRGGNHEHRHTAIRQRHARDRRHRNHRRFADLVHGQPDHHGQNQGKQFPPEIFGHPVAHGLGKLTSLCRHVCFCGRGSCRVMTAAPGLWRSPNRWRNQSMIPRDLFGCTSNRGQERAQLLQRHIAHQVGPCRHARSCPSPRRRPRPPRRSPRSTRSPRDAGCRATCSNPIAA